MMDPELIRIAQEQMSRMSPADFARIQQQMMSNPELVKMASESMKNLRPEDLKHAAEQLKHTRPEEMAEIGQKMANASPEEIASMRARMDTQVSYEINAAQMLKKQGNELHSQGRYGEAMEKYALAKKNLKGVPDAKARNLLCVCSLNMMSCYLKNGQYEDCIKEAAEVLAYDEKNLKAFYRRGQAYKALGQLQDAVSDLTKAHELSSDDETIAEVLRDAEEKLAKEGGAQTSRGVIIEEITEEVATELSQSHKSSAEVSAPKKPSEINGQSHIQPDLPSGFPSTSTEYLQALKDDPESIRSFQNFISRTDPETFAALNNGNTEGMSPEMVKTATDVIGKMSPQELQRMIQLASSFQGGNQFSSRGNNRFGPGSVPSEVSPEMLKMASEMMSKMSPEDHQRMFNMASSLKGSDAAAAVNSSGFRSFNQSRTQDSQNNIEVNDNANMTSTSQGFPSSRASPQSSSTGLNGGDLQDQMRNQMNDPAMRQMFSSMIKNMNPEMMANMSQQFGLKLSPEDAAKAQQAMSSLSPADLDRMMRWADRIQRGVEGVKKTKNWLLGKPGMLMAILMLLLAVLLHWLGYIGR